MKAAVCYEAGKPLVVEEVEIDSPQQGEVKVRMVATAVCHSDIHALRGEFPVAMPLLAGHESAGYVEEVGKNVTRVKPGDAVVISCVASCGKCLYCTTGFPHLCEAGTPSDTGSHFHNKRGQTIAQMAKVGSFAEYTIVGESQVVTIPENMPMDRASLLACGVITGFGAVVNRAQVKPLSSVVVIGTGGVGLNAIQGAAFVGAYPVIAVDVMDSKLEAAKRFGATHTVNAKNVDPIKTVKGMTSGRGANYVFITVGSGSAINQGTLMLSPRGMAVMVGLPSMKDSVTIPPMEFLDGERMFTACRMGSVNLSVDIPKLVSLYQAGKLKLDELITERYPLEKINEAIEAVEKGKALRNVIMF